MHMDEASTGDRWPGDLPRSPERFLARPHAELVQAIPDKKFYNVNKYFSYNCFFQKEPDLIYLNVGTSK